MIKYIRTANIEGVVGALRNAKVGDLISFESDYCVLMLTPEHARQRLPHLTVRCDTPYQLLKRVRHKLMPGNVVLRNTTEYGPWILDVRVMANSEVEEEK